MRSTIRSRLVVNALGAIAVTIGAASALAEELQAPTRLPPEIRRIQQSLGGFT
jgi:hypothetical protein